MDEMLVLLRVILRRMGTWGTGIFASDDAADVRQEFRDLIGGGATAEEASTRIINQYCIGGGAGAEVEDNVDNVDVFLALAAVQHQTGHVVPRIIDLALQKIEAPEQDLERFEEPSDRKARVKVLQRFGEKLREPAPAPKVIRPKRLSTTDLLLGQHLVVTDPETGARLLLRVSEFHEDAGGRTPVVLILDWNGDDSVLPYADLMRPIKTRWGQQVLGSIVFGRKPKEQHLQLLDVRIHPMPYPRIIVIPEFHWQETSARWQRSTHFCHHWNRLFEHVDWALDEVPASMAAYRASRTALNGSAADSLAVGAALADPVRAEPDTQAEVSDQVKTAASESTGIASRFNRISALFRRERS
ncbi:hypothetical protein ACX80N_16795 [Arthrobacter sp. MDT2-16]